MNPITKFSSLLFIIGVVCLSILSCSPTSPKPEPTVPDAPTGVTATAGDGHVLASWDTVSGAASYFVYYAAGTTVTKLGNRISATASPCTLSGLKNDTQYAVAVTAVNADGESDLSNTATATPYRSIPPALALTSGDGQMILSWTTDPTVTSYTVYWAQGNTITKSAPNKIERVSVPCTVTGLVNLQLYSFGIAAVKNGVEGALLDSGNAHPVPKPLIQQILVGNGRVTITWDSAIGATGYRIYYASGNTVDKSGIKLVGVASPQVVPGLINSMQYAFALSVVYPWGESGLSPVYLATPLIYADDKCDITLSLGSATVFAGQNLAVSGEIDGYQNELTISYAIEKVGGGTVNGVFYSANTVSGMTRVDLASDAALMISTTTSACNGKYYLGIYASAGAATVSKRDTFTVTGGTNCEVLTERNGTIANMAGPDTGAFDLVTGTRIGASGAAARKDLMDLSQVGAGFAGALGSGNGTTFAAATNTDFANATGATIQALAANAVATSISIQLTTVFVAKLGVNRGYAIVKIIRYDPAAGASVGANKGEADFVYKFTH